MKKTILAILLLSLSLACYSDKNSCITANRQMDPNAPEICKEALAAPGVSADDKSIIYVTHASYLISHNQFNEANQILDLAFNSNPKMLENGLYRYNWLRTKGKLFFSKEEFIKALPFFSGSNEVAEIMGQSRYKATSYNDLGATYLELQEYSQALVWLKKSLNIYKLENDNALIAASLANIAEVYLATDDYENSLENFKSSETILKNAIQQTPDQADRYEIPLAKIYISMANLFSLQNFYAEASAHLQEALSLYKKYQLKGQQVKVLSTMGWLYLQQFKLDQSLQVLIQAESLENTLESQDNLELKLNLALAYMSNKDWDKAELIALQGLSQSKSKKDTLKEASFLESLATIYESTKQFEKSIKHLKLLEQINKLNYENRYNLSHAKLLNEIETTKEQRELLKLEKQQSLQNLESSKQRFIFLILAITLIGLILYLLFLLNRKEKIKNEILSDQSEHRNQLSLLSINKDRIQQLFDGMDCRIICFDSTGFIQYKSPKETVKSKNSSLKMQEDYKEIWMLILPYLTESEKINKELLLKNNTINNPSADIWFNQMEFLDDILVCIIFNNNSKNDQELNCIDNIRKYSQLMQKLSQFYIHNQNIPINDSKQLNQVLHCFKNYNINSDTSADQNDENNNSKQNLKVQLVDLMILCIDAWQVSTGKTPLELAEESGFWLVSIEDGQLRTRTMNKYSDIKKIPKNPRWRQVVKTAHYILSNCELNINDRKRLNEKVKALKQLIRNRATGQ